MENYTELVGEKMQLGREVTGEAEVAGDPTERDVWRTDDVLGGASGDDVATDDWDPLAGRGSGEALLVMEAIPGSIPEPEPPAEDGFDKALLAEIEGRMKGKVEGRWADDRSVEVVADEVGQVEE